MTKTSRKPADISQEDWDAADIPELTEEDFKKMRPASETHPKTVQQYRRARGRQRSPTKTRVTIRLDRDIVQRYRRAGRGWQTRMNDDLRSLQ